MNVRLTAVLLLLSLCSCVHKPAARRAVEGITVTFFDVGQGDAALLKTGEATVVIDTGRNGRVARLLRQEGITHIDLLILSHPHVDHTGGLAAILRSIPVSELWFAGEYHGKIKNTLDAIPKAEAVFAGKQKMMGRLSILVLHPEFGSPMPHSGNSAVNNGSVVVRAVYDDTEYFFPGDCELGCWEELFKLHRQELRSDILKLTHHGSWNGTNSGVLINVRPETVIISCGRKNEYGHPHEIVLSMLRKLGANVFRTDEQGTIRCKGPDCRIAPE